MSRIDLDHYDLGDVKCRNCGQTLLTLPPDESKGTGTVAGGGAEGEKTMGAPGVGDRLKNSYCKRMWSGDRRSQSTGKDMWELVRVTVIIKCMCMASVSPSDRQGRNSTKCYPMGCDILTTDSHVGISNLQFR